MQMETETGDTQTARQTEPIAISQCTDSRTKKNQYIVRYKKMQNQHLFYNDTITFGKV